MKKKRVIITVASIVAALATIAVISSGILYYIVKSPQINIDETAYIYIYPHDNSDSVINKIKAVAAPSSTLGFKILAEHNDFDSKKRSGKFAIKDKDSWHSIYSRIVTKQQTPVKVVVPSVRSFEQLSKVVSEQLMFDSLAIQELFTSNVFVQNLGYTFETLPTLILPDTYEFYWNVEPERFFIRMMNERKKFWNEDRQGKGTEYDSRRGCHACIHSRRRD